MPTQYKDVKKWRQLLKERLVEGFGGICCVCKMKDHPVIYDFHHLDSDRKEFTLSGKIRAWKIIVEEAQKCVMLCSHCHRKIHSGLAVISEIIRFDESLITRFTSTPTRECPICQKDMPHSKTTCSIQCAKIHRMKIDWRIIDLVALKHKYGTVVGIARFLGVSDKSVKKRLLEQGLI